MDAKPLEGLNDVFLCSGDKPTRVGILNPQKQLSALIFGKEVIIKSGAYTTDMKWSGRTGCKSYSYL